MHFKKIARYTELEISAFYYCTDVFKQLAFFGSIEQCEKHQLYYLITNRMSKHMLSKSCKGAPKVATIFAT